MLFEFAVGERGDVLYVDFAEGFGFFGYAVVDAWLVCEGIEVDWIILRWVIGVSGGCCSDGALYVCLSSAPWDHLP